VADLVAELDRVSKSYGSVTALLETSLCVNRGEFVAVLGPNGAGKTTAINLLVGTRRPDSGSASLFGRDPRQHQNRSRIGATPQETRFPLTLKTREILVLVAAHYPSSHSIEGIAQDFSITDILERQVGGLSGGQQRRLSVALAFVGRPELVFLDEPTTGLDVTSRLALWEHIRNYRASCGSLLMTTHYLEEAEALADRIVVIDKGSVLFEGTVTEIRTRLGVTRVSLTTPDVTKLPATPMSVEGNRVTLYVQDADALVREIVKQNIPFVDLEIRPVSLEEAFLALTAE
jgi:ABC-2 type transport system ATP-binding protein